MELAGEAVNNEQGVEVELVPCPCSTKHGRVELGAAAMPHRWCSRSRGVDGVVNDLVFFRGSCTYPSRGQYRGQGALDLAERSEKEVVE